MLVSATVRDFLFSEMFRLFGLIPLQNKNFKPFRSASHFDECLIISTLHHVMSSTQLIEGISVALYSALLSSAFVLIVVMTRNVSMSLIFRQTKEIIRATVRTERVCAANKFRTFLSLSLTHK